MTTDDKTPDATPALLSAAHLAEIRERARLLHSEGAAWHAVDDRRALLAHLDALTPRAPVDGEALGRGLYLRHHAGNAESIWPQLAYQEQRRWITAALALHATGYAARASEGEAERARLQALLAAEHESAGVVIEGQQSEIARLTAALEAERARRPVEEAAIAEAQRELDATRAELAEARALHEAVVEQKIAAHAEEIRLLAKRDAEAIAAARLDGAREEREAIRHAAASGCARTDGAGYAAYLAIVDLCDARAKDGKS